MTNTLSIASPIVPKRSGASSSKISQPTIPETNRSSTVSTARLATAGSARPTATTSTRRSGRRRTTRKEAGESQQRRVRTEAGHERRPDHDEVEHVPTAREVAPRVGAGSEEANHELDHEDREAHLVEQIEQVAVAPGDRVVGAGAEHGRVEEDDHDDRAVEGGACGQAPARVEDRGRGRAGGGGPGHGANRRSGSGGDLT